MVCKKFVPKNVLKFFYEISKIPRGSGNMSNITEYCLRFAKERGLKSFQDDAGNIMIFKDGTKGYENREAIILQGHLDMVCEKRENCKKNMDQEGVDVLCDGKYLYADGTTLGGDNGIAIAYILAILDDNGTISHPPLEALLTVDEEIGLNGANKLDSTNLKGKRLINLDSEEEGVLTVSCAGGVRVNWILPVLYDNNSKKKCAKTLSVKGLLSGHSGMDIGKGRKNAAILLTKFIYELKNHFPIHISNFESGGRLNVIPSTASATICFDSSLQDHFERLLSNFNVKLKIACAQTEPNAEIISVAVDSPDKYLNRDSSNILISALMLIPNGVLEICEKPSILIKTSSNLGSVSIQNDKLILEFLIRSNVENGKNEIIEKFRCLSESLGGILSLSEDYPAWEYQSMSPLREVMAETYESMYGKKMSICSIHAGLECGIFAKKITGLDMVSIGPNMENVHTPSERVEIESVIRCWEFLLKVLENLK